VPANGGAQGQDPTPASHEDVDMHDNDGFEQLPQETDDSAHHERNDWTDSKNFSLADESESRSRSDWSWNRCTVA
jgi:hypothetical protein